MLTEPRPALAEQSTFHHALVGLVGLAELVRELAPLDVEPEGPGGEPDAFVYLLLGLVSLGGAVERLGRAGHRPPGPDPPAPPSSSAPAPGWLR
jgi:hypothetical protein